MTAFDRVKKLADQQKISIVELEEKLGFSRNSLYAWKRSNPSTDKLKKVADYFNVSTDYILGRSDDFSIASDKDKNLKPQVKALSRRMNKMGDDDLDFIIDLLNKIDKRS